MNHIPAHILRLNAHKFNHAYGQREVESLGIFGELEKCSMQGQTGCSFKGPISGHAIKYMQSLGYEVERKEGNDGFYVGFENAVHPQTPA